jgi:potassium channel subfamily K
MAAADDATATASHPVAAAPALLPSGSESLTPASGIATEAFWSAHQAAVAVQARFRGRRARRARRAAHAADAEMLYTTKAKREMEQVHWGRRLVAAQTEALTAGIAPYVHVRHALYTRAVDRMRGVECKRVKSQQDLGETHACFLKDSMKMADFALYRGRNLDTKPENTFTFLIPAALAADEVDELQLQVLSKEHYGHDSFVGVAILDLNQLRDLAADQAQKTKHEWSLWVKHAGRRQGSIDFETRLRPVTADNDSHHGAYAVGFDRGAVTEGRPSNWGERDVLSCTIRIMSTHGLRDPNAIAQPLTELKNAANVVNVIKSLLFLLLYIAVGCAFYSLVPCALYGDGDLGEEELDGECDPATFVDALYFSVVTLTTVGYGDMGPQTPGTRLFTCFFGAAGISVGAMSLGIFVDEVQKFRHRQQQETEHINFAFHFTGRYADDEEQEQEEENGQEQEEEGEGGAGGGLKRWRRRCTYDRCVDWLQGNSTPAASVWMLVCILAGALYYYFEKSWRDTAEDCSFIDALYFAVISSTTIGYGDESPQTWGGRLIAVFYLPMTTVFFCNLVGALASKTFEEDERLNEELVQRQFGDQLTAEELRMLCKVGAEATCTYHEYVLAMMVKLGKIDQDDIDSCRVHFAKLDRDGDGSLTVKDLSEKEMADYNTGHGIRTTDEPDAAAAGGGGAAAAASKRQRGDGARP